MKKNYQARVVATVRSKTEHDLREYVEKTGHTLSLVVDLAIEEYLKRQLSTSLSTEK